ncbi:Sugar phosphate isomerase/epimerase [Terribacillus halophilus]|uniref:Sugar phosphate isomerase/epimerase n=1 Tax=Terribacillus halophilus TaxID=361279 RepID=A0A1G6I315_9BACI|nr:Sugar phosphate isomerase/epimerase [Terribacillus halophilus]
MNLGIRGHDFSTVTAETLAEQIKQKGLTAVQLALGKSFPHLQTDAGSLTPGLGATLRQTFEQHGITIAVLGCYINMIHPDPKKRRTSLDTFKEHLKWASDFGCRIVATETGNVREEIVYTEDNFHEEPFQQVVESVRELAIEAEKFGVCVGIEAGVNHPIHSADKLKRLLETIRSSNVTVIFDPVNLLTTATYTDQDKIITQAFELLADDISIIHAKDFTIQDGKLVTVPVGTGMLNYELLFSLIHKKKPYIQIILESTKEPHIEKSIAYLRSLYSQLPQHDL